MCAYLVEIGHGIVYIVLSHCQEYTNDVLTSLFTIVTDPANGVLEQLWGSIAWPQEALLRRQQFGNRRNVLFI